MGGRGKLGGGALAQRLALYAPRFLGALSHSRIALKDVAARHITNVSILSLRLPPCSPEPVPGSPLQFRTPGDSSEPPFSPSRSASSPPGTSGKRRVTGAAAAVYLGTRPAPCRLKARSCVNFWRFGELGLWLPQKPVGVCLSLGMECLSTGVGLSDLRAGLFSSRWFSYKAVMADGPVLRQAIFISGVMCPCPRLP